VRLAHIENFLRRAGLDEFRQHLAAAVARVLDLAVELAVGKGAGAAFAELNIGIGIEFAPAPEGEGVDRALAHDLAALEHERAETHLGEDKGGEQAAGAGADHHRAMGKMRGRLGHMAIAGVGGFAHPAVLGEAFQDLGLVGHIGVDGVDQADVRRPAGIESAAENGVAAQATRLDGKAF
jgi:hypothetical protein